MTKRNICMLRFLFMVQVIIFPLLLRAQDKQDLVFMLNGEKKTGKVLAVKADLVRFSYSGESLEYEIPKADIDKIVFASGRTEQFAEIAAAPASPGTAQATTPQQRSNKVAVLPFEIYTNDPGLESESMSKQVQLSCVNALRSQSQRSIQDPMVTNALLTKQNLSVKNLSAHTPKEWAELLEVEYVVMGVYSIQNKGTYSSGSGVSSYNTKKSDNKDKGTSVSSSSSYTTASYDTKVSLSIYNDKGETIFSDTKTPLMGSIDSYNGAVKSLVKKSPLKAR